MTVRKQKQDGNNLETIFSSKITASIIKVVILEEKVVSKLKSFMFPSKELSWMHFDASKFRKIKTMFPRS